MADIVGWDIGGVHTKAVWLPDGEQGELRSSSRVFEIWRAGEKLPDVLRCVYDSLGIGRPDAMAVTMTAELVDVFESKRQGVLFVLKTLRRTFPDTPIFLLSLDPFHPPGDRCCPRSRPDPCRRLHRKHLRERCENTL